MEETRIDEVMTPAEAGVPRRFAVQSIVGGLAGLAALGAAGVGAQEKKTAKKKSSKQQAQAKKKKNAAARRGTLSRIRQIDDSVNVPSSSHRELLLTCPRPNNNERVYVVGGGYTHTTNSPNFVVKTNAPTSNSAWLVDGHNTSGVTVGLGAAAICLYFRK